MFSEVPVVPVVAPIAGVVLMVLLWHLRRRQLLSAPRAAVAAALCVYAAGVVANTVFPIYLDKPGGDAAWSSQLVLTPWSEYEVADAVMNVVVFVPLGILASLILARPSWWRVVAASAICSLVIELAQLVTAHSYGGGHIADVHDLIFNVVGGVVGATLVSLVARVSRLDRLVGRFRWSGADGAHATA